jgi:hypothetical protein
MRTKPIPHAYRSFFRQIGLDPDVDRIPSERVAVARLAQGGFRSVDMIADACLIALVETGVPVWALDAQVVAGERLQIRPVTASDHCDVPLDPGTLAICSQRSAHAQLFGDPWPGHAPGPATRRVVLYTIGVQGVPAIHLEEALWSCIELLS